jgi:hypothetical protein
MLAEEVRCPCWRKEYDVLVGRRHMVSLLWEGVRCPCGRSIYEFHAGVISDFKLFFLDFLRKPFKS